MTSYSIFLIHKVSYGHRNGSDIALFILYVIPILVTRQTNKT